MSEMEQIVLEAFHELIGSRIPIFVFSSSKECDYTISLITLGILKNHNQIRNILTIDGWQRKYRGSYIDALNGLIPLNPQDNERQDLDLPLEGQNAVYGIIAYADTAIMVYWNYSSGIQFSNELLTGGLLKL